MSNMKAVKVRYISDMRSIFFEKGKEYNAFILTDRPKADLVVFFFNEDEMDEEGYYALPASRFEIIQ